VGGGALQIKIDRTACRGAGECVFRADRTFALAEDRRAKLTGVQGDDDDRVLAAARACPHFAIVVLRDGRRLV
jgi:ferredoxin